MIPPLIDTGLGRERIRTVIVEDHDRIGCLLARRIAQVIQERRAAGKRPGLGPAPGPPPIRGDSGVGPARAPGSTPSGVYRELIRMHRDEGLSFADVVTFNLDEYYPMDPGSIHAYHRFMWENLFSQLDIPPANVHLPRGDVRRDEVEGECRRYEDAIAAAGGIDLQ